MGIFTKGDTLLSHNNRFKRLRAVAAHPASTTEGRQLSGAPVPLFGVAHDNITDKNLATNNPMSTGSLSAMVSGVVEYHGDIPANCKAGDYLRMDDLDGNEMKVGDGTIKLNKLSVRQKQANHLFLPGPLTDETIGQTLSDFTSSVSDANRAAEKMKDDLKDHKLTFQPWKDKIEPTGTAQSLKLTKVQNTFINLMEKSVELLETFSNDSTNVEDTNQQKAYKKMKIPILNLIAVVKEGAHKLDVGEKAKYKVTADKITFGTLEYYVKNANLKMAICFSNVKPNSEYRAWTATLLSLNHLEIIKEAIDSIISQINSLPKAASFKAFMQAKNNNMLDIALNQMKAFCRYRIASGINRDSITPTNEGLVEQLMLKGFLLKAPAGLSQHNISLWKTEDSGSTVPRSDTAFTDDPSLLKNWEGIARTKDTLPLYDGTPKYFQRVSVPETDIESIIDDYNAGNSIPIDPNIAVMKTLELISNKSATAYAQTTYASFEADMGRDSHLSTNSVAGIDQHNLSLDDTRCNLDTDSIANPFNNGQDVSEITAYMEDVSPILLQKHLADFDDGESVSSAFKRGVPGAIALTTTAAAFSQSVKHGKGTVDSYLSLKRAFSSIDPDQVRNSLNGKLEGAVPQFLADVSDRLGVLENPTRCGSHWAHALDVHDKSHPAVMLRNEVCPQGSTEALEITSALFAEPRVDLPPAAKRTTLEAEYASGLVDPHFRALIRQRHGNLKSTELMAKAAADISNGEAQAFYIKNYAAGHGQPKANQAMLVSSGMTKKDAKAIVGPSYTRELLAQHNLRQPWARATSAGFIDIDLANAKGCEPSKFVDQWSVPKTKEWLEQPLGSGVVRTRFSDGVHELELDGVGDVKDLCDDKIVPLPSGHINSGFLMHADQSGIYKFPENQPSSIPIGTSAQLLEFVPPGATLDVDGVRLGLVLDADPDSGKAIVALDIVSYPPIQHKIDKKDKMLPAIDMAPQQAVYVQVEVEIEKDQKLLERGTLLWESNFQPKHNDHSVNAVLRVTQFPADDYQRHFVGVIVDTIPCAGKKMVRACVCIAGAVPIRYATKETVNNCIRVSGPGAKVERILRVLAVEEDKGPYVLLS